MQAVCAAYQRIEAYTLAKLSRTAATAYCWCCWSQMSQVLIMYGSQHYLLQLMQMQQNCCYIGTFTSNTVHVTLMCFVLYPLWGGKLPG